MEKVMAKLIYLTWALHDFAAKSLGRKLLQDVLQIFQEDGIFLDLSGKINLWENGTQRT